MDIEAACSDLSLTCAVPVLAGYVEQFDTLIGTLTVKEMVRLLAYTNLSGYTKSCTYALYTIGAIWAAQP